MGDGCWDVITADALVEITRRLRPPSSRFRLRLVCQHWRDVIDEPTPERNRLHRRATVLAFSRSRAYVLDDNLSGQPVRYLDLQGSGEPLGTGSMSMIGTCNGLLCLMRCEEMSSASIVVLNPRGIVFTLWEDSRFKWWKVPVPDGSSCGLRFGILSIDGVTYWVTHDGERMMSFDHKDERVAFVESPPSLPALLWMKGYRCHLVDVRGRLGLAVFKPRDGTTESAHTEVRLYCVGAGGRKRGGPSVGQALHRDGAHGKTPCQEIALPHAVHGAHILTTGFPLKPGRMRRLMSLYAHKPRHEM
ncbi:hypothetical protein QOZ80_5BG0421620 [Eleusine coracana subsp. coracana]|nr:hypothetical protein QOZ80_5BG0421620 [Eleusine coracana subsp. coracana]